MAMTPLQTLKALRLMYDTPMTREQNGALLNALCWTLGDTWGMFTKNDDNSAIHPNGETISRDVLVNKRTRVWVDCLQDAEGAGTPVWEEHPNADIAGWVAPIKPSTEPVPTPIPPTPPVVVPQPPVTSYNQFLNVEMPLLRAAYIEKHNRTPAYSDCDHLAYRRLVERWTIADMVKDI